MVRSLAEHGDALFAQACVLHLDGIVGRDLGAAYKRGVQPLKAKNPTYCRQEALGFRIPCRYQRPLVVGPPDPSAAIRAMNVGFTRALPTLPSTQCAPTG